MNLESPRVRAVAALLAVTMSLGPLEALAEEGRPAAKRETSAADREVLEISRRAQALFESLEFESARALLEAGVLRLPELAGSKARSRARLWMLLGRARAELGDAAGADDAFYEAMLLDRTVRLPAGTSPKIVEAMERTRRVAPRRRATTARKGTLDAPSAPQPARAAPSKAIEPAMVAGAPEWEPIYDEEKERRAAARVAAEAARLADDAGREAEGARKKAESELARAETARARAEEERRRADAEQQKAKSALAATAALRADSEIARAKAEAEKAQAEAARAKAEAEKAQAEAEKARAEAAQARSKAEIAKAKAEEEKKKAELERIAAERKRAKEKQRPPELRHRLTGKLLLGEKVELAISREGLAPGTRLALYVSRDPTRPFSEQALVRTGSISSARITLDEPEVRFHVRAVLAGKVVGEIGNELEPVVLRTPTAPPSIRDAWSSVESAPNAWALAPSRDAETTTASSPLATLRGRALPDPAPQEDSALLYMGLAGGVVLFLGVAAAIVFAFKGSPECEAKRGYGCTEVQVSPLVSF